MGASQGLRSNVALVQISSCGGECCKSHDQCLQTLADKAKHMIAICDPNQRLRREYGVRAGAAVFVLDGHGRVVSESSLQDLADSVKRAGQLAADAEQEREILYGG